MNQSIDIQSLGLSKDMNKKLCLCRFRKNVWVGAKCRKTVFSEKHVPIPQGASKEIEFFLLYNFAY